MSPGPFFLVSSFGSLARCLGLGGSPGISYSRGLSEALLKGGWNWRLEMETQEVGIDSCRLIHSSLSMFPGDCSAGLLCCWDSGCVSWLVGYPALIRQAFSERQGWSDMLKLSRPRHNPSIAIISNNHRLHINHSYHIIVKKEGKNGHN